jgi:hypothetical protein
MGCSCVIISAESAEGLPPPRRFGFGWFVGIELGQHGRRSMGEFDRERRRQGVASAAVWGTKW